MSTISERFFPSINKEEYLPLLKAFGFFFFVLASWYVLRPIRNELAVEFGYENLMILGFSVNPISLLLTVGALVMLAVNPIYSFVISKIEGSKVVLYCYSSLLLISFCFFPHGLYLRIKGGSGLPISSMSGLMFILCLLFLFSGQL